MVDQVKEFDPDASLDDIDDLPGFTVFHSGAVLVHCVEQARKPIGDHDGWALKVQLKEWLANEEEPKEGETLAKVGDIMDIAYMLDNPTGLGKMKQFLAPIKAKLGIDKTSELWAALPGMDLVIAGKRTWNKDKEKFFYSVTNVMVP